MSSPPKPSTELHTPITMPTWQLTGLIHAEVKGILDLTPLMRPTVRPKPSLLSLPNISQALVSIPTASLVQVQFPLCSDCDNP